MSRPYPSKLEIGERIKELRRSRGLTLQELAERAGMSAGYLSEVERGGSALSGEKLAALAGCLGVTVDYILWGVGARNTTGETRIPAGLAEAAEMLDLSYAQTIRLLAGKESLVARRSNEREQEWSAQDWIRFHEKVSPYL